MKKKISVLIFSSILMAGCLGDSNSPNTFAIGSVDAEFREIESGDPVTGQTFNVQVEPQDSEEVFDFGDQVTDEDGFLRTDIYGQMETTVNKITYRYVLNGDTVSVSEDIELNIKFEEPLETVSLEFDIEINNESGTGEAQ